MAANVREERKMEKQQQLNQACADASGNGVGWVGIINTNGTVTLRRYEEFANSKKLTFESLDAALARLKQES